MSGGAMVWLTNKELALLQDWHWLAREFDSEVTNTDADWTLAYKLDAVREEIARRARPGNGR